MRHTGFDDAGFFTRDLSERAAEDFDMVAADVGCDGQDRREDIGGIETPPQTGFDDGDIYLLTLEILEGQRGDDFKEREFFFTRVAR